METTDRALCCRSGVDWTLLARMESMDGGSVSRTVPETATSTCRRRDFGGHTCKRVPVLGQGGMHGYFAGWRGTKSPRQSLSHALFLERNNANLGVGRSTILPASLACANFLPGSMLWHGPEKLLPWLSHGIRKTEMARLHRALHSTGF